MKICSSLLDDDGRFLMLKVEINELKYILVNIYGPNNDNPDFFLEVFSKLEEIGNSSIILAGDLNIAVGPLDYKGTCSHHKNIHAKDIFNCYVDDFNLIDVWRREHINTQGFTRQQQNPIVSSRLDYIFVSSDLISQIKKI